MEKYLNTSAQCRENAGHKQFVTSSLFKPSHLPDSIRSQLVWALIYHKARPTVKLVVNYVSHNRPVEFQRQYTNRITGSGYVTCIDESNPEKVTITIDTAAHVVFDGDEASSTIAKFYFNSSQEVFQIRQASLLVVNPRKDRSTIMFTKDLELVSPWYLQALKYALTPSVLPDVNQNVNISLLQSVIARFKIISIPWLLFLFGEIKCLRKLKYISNENQILEIENNFSHVLLYDTILLIIALASRRDYVINFMKEIVCRNDIDVDTAQRPFVTLAKEILGNDGVAKSTSKMSLQQFVNTDSEPLNMVNSAFTIQQNLYQLMTCFIKSPVEIVDLNEALTSFCGFDISARFKRPGVIVFKIPVAYDNMPDRMSLEINLHDVKVEDIYDHAAVLISHPHDDMPQQITVGHLDQSTGHSEISYTTPSCPGSSGGQVSIIPREPKSLEELENIELITHSCATSGRGFGN